MKPSGAAVFGWPLLWALPMLAYRALGFGLSEARRVGLRRRALARSRRAHGRRRRVPRPQRDRPPLGRPARRRVLDGLAGARRRRSPATARGRTASGRSTSACTTTASRCRPCSSRRARRSSLSPRRTQLQLALAGCALSAATLVKVSNGLLAAAALVVVFLRGRTREALPYLAGALSLAPLVAVYWPLSYPKLFDNPQSWPRDPFDPGHIVTSWTHSSIFDAAHARDHRAARDRRRARDAPAVGARARARVPGDQPGLLQLLREHGAASALPLREPARALRAVGGRHTRARAASRR